MMDTNKRCKITDQISGSQSHGGVRRRRDTYTTSSGSDKKRKFDHGDHQKVIQPENDCQNDLNVELRFESETSMCSNDGFSKEASASSEICLDSDEMESSSTLKKKTSSKLAAASCRKPITVSNCPTAAEIDEFFSIAEKKEEKRFMDKYNYDIVNDVPMEGRYQWVRLKP
ncbi:cyclin-dependent kinase inhibitor 7-like isoform X2 [Rutidosis leptorrhynchoides]|uniref:cyclin-dependent kinase inhibitor 7-like isoform X2 n=1 Tax=Rutidosis leptorrhynchoides TaxID=125765 RepID=UPI003A9A00BE